MFHPSAVARPFALWALLCIGLRLHAQELSLLGGVQPATSSEKSTPIWELDYRQDLFQNLAASMSYINEGHITDHHRDGSALEAWAVLPLFDNQFTLSLGGGVYYFYDTQSLPDGSSVDVHGTAPIFSLSATGFLCDRWLVRINFNRIAPTRDFTENSVTVGLGYWFGQDQKPTPNKFGDATSEQGHVTGNELSIFGGQSVANTFLHQKSPASAVEYRRGLMEHVDGTLSYFYEGDPESDRRNGFATQLWAVNTFFKNRIMVGVGLGPYVYLEKKHPTDTKVYPGAVAPLASLTVGVQLSEHWVTRIIFDRVATSYNRDSDIFLMGLGCSW